MWATLAFLIFTTPEGSAEARHLHDVRYQIQAENAELLRPSVSSGFATWTHNTGVWIRAAEEPYEEEQPPCKGEGDPIDEGISAVRVVTFPDGNVRVSRAPDVSTHCFNGVNLISLERSEWQLTSGALGETIIWMRPASSYQFPAGEILEWDAHMNGVEFEFGTGPEQRNLDSAMLHELGHTFGIAHTELNPEIEAERPVMYFGLEKGEVRTELRPDDLAAIQHLYGSEGSLQCSCIDPTEARLERAATTGNGLTLAGLFLIAFASRKRSRGD